MPRKNVASNDNPFLFDPSSYHSLPKQPELTIKPKLIKADRVAQLDSQCLMLSAMLQIDFDPGLLAEILAWSTPELSNDQYRYLSGALHVHNAIGWMEDFKSPSMRWLVQAVYQDRLEVVTKELKTGESDGLATPAEVLACMYPATMAAPLHHDWNNVYFYVGSIVFPKYNKIPEGEDFFEWMGMSKVTYQQVKWDYEKLARDIRRRVIKSAAEAGISLTKKSKKNPNPDQAALFEEAS